jgi:hypothetical protein
MSMNRRELLKTGGTAVISLVFAGNSHSNIVESEKCLLTVENPEFNTVKFFGHETIPKKSIDRLEKAFSLNDKTKEYSGNKKILDQINEIIVEKNGFVWSAWIHDRKFNLFLAGNDSNRFNYHPNKVCMWERQMYVRDGMDNNQALKFDFMGKTLYGKCHDYWCSVVNIGPVQRYRYDLF